MVNMVELTRDQQKAMYARQAIQNRQSENLLPPIQTSNIPKTEHSVTRLKSFFEKRRIYAKEKDAVKQAQEAQKQKAKEDQKKKIAEQYSKLEQENIILQKLKDGSLKASDLVKLEQSTGSDKMVLPKDFNEKNKTEKQRYFEKIRSPSPIFPTGAEYKRYNKETKGFDNRLTEKEQKALGENPEKLILVGIDNNGQYIFAPSEKFTTTEQEKTGSITPMKFDKKRAEITGELDENSAFMKAILDPKGLLF